MKTKNKKNKKRQRHYFNPIRNILFFILLATIATFSSFSINASVENASSKQTTNIEVKTEVSSNENVATVPDVKKINTIYISDKAHLLTNATKQDLLKIGTDLDNKYKAQIAVYTIDSLEGKSIEEYANELFRKIGIGDKNKNNGVLILVAKKDHKARIEVGYGLEGAIPDGKAGRILKTMLNEFKKDKYDEGIRLAYGQIANEIYKANNDKAKVDVGEVEEDDDIDIVFIIIVIIILFIIFVILENNSGGGYHGGGGYYSGGSSWSSGSSSGGSWGGGSSGGGGASGNW